MKRLLIAFTILMQNAYAQTEEDCKIYTEAFSKIVFGKKFVIYEKEDTQYLSNNFITKESNYYSEYTKSDSSIKQLNFKAFSCKNLKVKTISDKDITQIWNGRRGWKRFYRKNKDARGFIRISRIFYNENHNKAIFYLSYSRGFLNAAGASVFMSKNDKHEWIVDNVEHEWAS